MREFNYKDCKNVYSRALYGQDIIDFEAKNGAVKYIIEGKKIKI